MNIFMCLCMHVSLPACLMPPSPPSQAADTHFFHCTHRVVHDILIVAISQVRPALCFEVVTDSVAGCSTGQVISMPQAVID